MRSYFPDLQWFPIFYLLALVLGAVLVIRAARRDGLPASKGFVLFLWAAVFGILGSRLAELSMADWEALLATGRVPDSGKTALGGILGAMLGLLLGRRLMGIQASVWEWFMAWPAVLAVFRVGCLLAGCCMGTPTGLPWALSYAAGTPACDLQQAHGLLDAHAGVSLPAHPVPLYEILFAGMLLWGMFTLLKRGWNRTALFFLSMIAYSVFRFAEEFIRLEHLANAALNPVQWALLATLPVLVFALWKAKRSYPAQSNAEITAPEWISVAVPLLVVALLRNSWTPGEFFALGILVLGYGAFKLLEMLRATQPRRLHWLVPMSLLAGVLLMSQAAIDQTVPDTVKVQSVEIGMGASFGRYRESCGPLHNYGVLGAGAQYTYNIGGKHQIEAGVRGFYGNDDNGTVTKQEIGANPYFAYQHRFFGGEVGVLLGQLNVNAATRVWIPEAALRLGPSDIAFLDLRVFNNGYAPIPGSGWRIGLGSGFGLKNGTVFRAGLCSGGFFVNPTIVIQRNFMVEPMAAYGSNSMFQLGLGLRVKLGL